MYTPQVNQLRSLDYRINMMMEQGRFSDAQKFITELLPLYDWFVSIGQDPRRIVGKDRQHYAVLSQQCAQRSAQEATGLQAWEGEVRAYIQQARADILSDLKSSASGAFRAKEMVEQKAASPENKAPLLRDIEALVNDLKAAAENAVQQARNTVIVNPPQACKLYEGAIEVFRRSGLGGRVHELEIEMGTAVYAQNTGSRIADVRDAISKASRKEDVERLNSEMERMRTELTTQMQSQAGAQNLAMLPLLQKMLSEVEETKRLAGRQSQVIVAQNVQIGDTITVRDSVVQGSQLGGAAAKGAAVGSSNIDVKDSVVFKSQVGGDAPAPAPQGQPPAGGFRMCPYCGKALDFPKPPKFCPFCTEKLM